MNELELDALTDAAFAEWQAQQLQQADCDRRYATLRLLDAQERFAALKRRNVSPMSWEMRDAAGDVCYWQQRLSALGTAA